MVTFECTNDNCENANINYNFLGNSETAMCGGCKATLVATDLRPDPEQEPEAQPEPEEA